MLTRNSAGPNIIGVRLQFNSSVRHIICFCNVHIPSLYSMYVMGRECYVIARTCYVGAFGLVVDNMEVSLQSVQPNIPVLVNRAVNLRFITFTYQCFRTISGSIRVAFTLILGKIKRFVFKIKIRGIWQLGNVLI